MALKKFKPVTPGTRFRSITARDAPTVLGILFFSSLVVIVANLVTDLVYSLIDPRIKLGHEG